MSFDSIPEDKEPSYPCDCDGEIKRNLISGSWECDSCGFIRGMPQEQCYCGATAIQYCTFTNTPGNCLYSKE